MPSLKPIEAAGPEQVVVAFRFQTDVGSAPDALVGGAGVVTAVANASGVYTCTIAKEFRYLTLVSCVAGVEGDPDKLVQFTSYTSATGALVVTGLDDGAGTHAAGEVADDAWIHVVAILCRRSEMAPSVAI